MKKNLSKFIGFTLLMAFLIVSNGCKKDKLEATISAKINGVDWSTTVVSGELEKLPLGNIKEMTIETDFSTNKKMELIIQEKTAVGDGITLGTYRFRDSISYNYLYYAEFFPPAATVNYSSPNEGSIIVTQCDPVAKTISGTFSAKIIKTPDDITISDGKFTNVPYVIK